MIYFSAARKLVKGETIQFFNYGNCKRDFTYIGDIIESVFRVIRGTLENLQEYILTLQQELVSTL